MQRAGYSLIEIFGAVAVMLTLVIIAIPSLRSFNEGSRQSALTRNAAALNSAVQQYDQSGGLLTARVPVPDKVSQITDPNQSPEMQVLNLLRSDERSAVSAWQDPVFSNEGYRVVWQNEVQDTQPIYAALSGDRSVQAETLLKSGSGGRFEIIGPEDQLGRLGIVDFRRGSLLVADLPTQEVPGVPTSTNQPPTVSLEANPPSVMVGTQVSYVASAQDPDGDVLDYSFAYGSQIVPSANPVFTQTYSSEGQKTVTVTVSDRKGGTATASASVMVSLTRQPPTVSLVASPTSLSRKDTVTYTATGSDPEGQPLTYQFIKDGAVVQEGAGTVYTTSYYDAGPKSVAVVAIDPDRLSARAQASVTVVPEYRLKARVVVEGGAGDPAKVVSLQGITLDGLLLAPDQDHTFKFTPSAGWVVTSVAGAPNLTYSPDVRRSGASSTIFLDDHKEITISLKPRPVVYYTNVEMPSGQGNFYPASNVSEAGQSFAAAAQAGGISSATIAGELGVANWTTASTAFTGPGVQHWVWRGSHVTWWIIRTATTTTTYNYSRSSNIVMLDGDSGEMLGVSPFMARPALGTTYGSIGQVTGTAIGSQPVSPLLSYSHHDANYRYTHGSPLVVDLNRNGLLDLPSKQAWGRVPGRYMDTKVMRKFRLDGTEEKLWEWIGSQDGLLVYNPKHDPVLSVTGFSLFGNFSFGRKWDNGYEALASLDADGNGLVDGSELGPIYVWKDNNDDAQVQAGELTSASEMKIKYLVTSPSIDEHGNAMAQQGAGLDDGGGNETVLSTWDWISYGGLDTKTKFSNDIMEDISTAYIVQSKGTLNQSHLFFGPTESGYRVFWTVKPKDFTTASSPFTILGDMLVWEGVADGERPMQVKVMVELVDGGKELRGRTTFEDGTVEEWTATLESGLPIKVLLGF